LYNNCAPELDGWAVLIVAPMSGSFVHMSAWGYIGIAVCIVLILGGNRRRDCGAGYASAMQASPRTLGRSHENHLGAFACLPGAERVHVFREADG
jgi:hypothetical protein